MQQLVTDVTGKPFPQLAQELVLGPLGMSRGTYQQPLPARFEANAAAGHEGDGVVRKGRWHTYPEIAAAGLWTTPSDLCRVVLELQTGGRVLKPATRREMLTKLLGDEMLGDCGLGIFLGQTAGHKWFKHAGSNAGFKCILFGYRDSGRGAVIMTNGNRGMALAEEILRSISAEYLWADYKPSERAVVHVEPGILQGYVGHYALLPGFEVTVTYENGRLFATAQGNKMELFPESATAFFSVEAEMPPKVTFTRGSDNSVVMSAGGVTARRQTGAPPTRR
jgi:hypothetical protein